MMKLCALQSISYYMNIADHPSSTILESVWTVSLTFRFDKTEALYKQVGKFNFVWFGTSVHGNRKHPTSAAESCKGLNPGDTDAHAHNYD